jgi:hypothetical protein
MIGRLGCEGLKDAFFKVVIDGLESIETGIEFGFNGLIIEVFERVSVGEEGLFGQGEFLGGEKDARYFL